MCITVVGGGVWYDNQNMTYKRLAFQPVMDDFTKLEIEGKGSRHHRSMDRLRFCMLDGEFRYNRFMGFRVLQLGWSDEQLDSFEL